VSVRILTGDCRATLATLDAGSVQTCVTSPPYFGLRDYGHAGQIGLEPTPDAYVAELVDVFRAVRRVLADDGTLWLNLGDSYAGSWGAQSRGYPTQEGEALRSGRYMEEWFEKDRGMSAQQIDAAPKRTHTGSLKNLPGLKAKDLMGIPWRVAFALQADGWYLRSDIIWHKPNPMPESVTDRPTKAHEYVFLLSKAERYFYDADAIAESAAPESAARYEYAFGGSKAERLTAEEASGPGTRTHPIGTRAFTGTRNARSVWQIATAPYSGAHFATMPPALAERCVKAGSRPGDTVLDPFGGAGTTGLVADRIGRHAVLCELNPAYATLAQARIQGDAPLFAEVDRAS
jgi:DNA modification methylase